ncbi:MAG: hypothetical protein AAFZ67_11335 [Planctomycetota bacterium]
MSIPTLVELRPQLLSPGDVFADPNLASGTIELDSDGLPKARSGTFASVFKVTTQQGDVAVRIPKYEDQSRVNRIRVIADYLAAHPVEGVVPVEVQPDGLSLGELSVSIQIMPWIKGRTLLEFVNDIHQDSRALIRLESKCCRLHQRMLAAQIAHGDLQHGNILIPPDGFPKVVDPDDFSVPGLPHDEAPSVGHPSYQHPRRTPHHFGPAIGNFAMRLIVLQLRIVASDSSLWMGCSSRPNPLDRDYLLLSASDLASPEQSPMLGNLLTHKRRRIRDAATRIVRMLELDPVDSPLPTASDPKKPQSRWIEGIPSGAMGPRARRAWMTRNLAANSGEKPS